MFSLTRRITSKALRVEILSKPDCCLCDQAHFAISRIVTNLGSRASLVTVEKVNIVSDSELMDEYGLTIPVVIIDGNVVSESTIDMPEIRNFIEDKLSS